LYLFTSKPPRGGFFVCLGGENRKKTMNILSFDTTALHIRRATEADFPRLVDMITALAAFNDDQATIRLDDLRRDLLGPSPWLVVMVASLHTSLIGYAALCPLARLQFGQRGIDIHHLFVEAAHRGQGVGRALLQASIQEAKALGCSYVKIATSDSNRVAQKAYLAAGFEVEAVRGPKFKMAV